MGSGGGFQAIECGCGVWVAERGGRGLGPMVIPAVASEVALTVIRV